MRRKRALALAAALAALGVAGWIWRGARGSGPGAIRVSGNLELTEVQMGFPMAGKLAERRVEEGQRVRKGQILAVLDREQTERQRDRVRASLEAARTRLAQQEAALRFLRESVAGQIEQRRAELRQAEALLEERLAGSRRQEIEQARAALAAARSEWEKARLDWERAEKLYKTGDIAASSWDLARTRRESAEAALKQARERAALVEE